MSSSAHTQDPRANPAGAAVEQAAHLETGHGEGALPTAMRLDSRKMGIWFFIASEVIIFASLIGTYIIFHGKTPPEEGIKHLELNVAATMTFILLMSSFTMVSALAKIQEGDRRSMVRYLIATAVLGLVFLGCQAFEWSLLFGEGINATTNIFGATFFTLTGFHGTHVFIGVLWITALVLRATRGTGFSVTNNMAVELGGLYWHFVDLVWVVIFMVVYLI